MQTSRLVRSVLPIAAVTVLLAAGSAPARARSGSRTPDWSRRLADLGRQVAALRADDLAGRSATAAGLAAFDREVTDWLTARGLTVGQAPPPSTRPADLVVELSRVRALVAQAESGAFYLGRVDIAVTGASPAGGVGTIGASDMRSLDARTVTDTLAAVPGVSLYRVGPRNEGAAYLRGFDLRQVPLFIDGVPVYVPYDGYVDLDRFVTADLAEVRVTRGMTSALIGPNALGGAINLVTRRPTRPVEGSVHLGDASGHERAVDGDVGGMRQGWYFYGAASWLQADDFPLPGGFVPTALEHGGARDHSSRRDALVNGKVALTPSGAGEYAINYTRQRARKDVPAYAGTDSAVKARFWTWPAWDKDSVYFAGNTPLPGSQYLRSRVYYDRFYNELDSYDDATYLTITRPYAFRSIYDDYTDGASGEYGVDLARQTLRASASIKEDIHREHNIGEPVRHFDNRTISTGVEDTIAISSAVSLVAGVSVDHQETRRAEDFVSGVVTPFPLGHAGGVNPQAAVSVAARGGGQFRFAAYHKTRLPAIKDRYSYRMGSAVPNPDLRAERATTGEVGYSSPLGRAGSVDVTAFYTAVTDLVQPFYLQPSLFQLQNVGDVRNTGLEAEWRARMARGLQTTLGYWYLHRHAVHDTGVPLLNTPAHSVFAEAIYSGVPRLQLVGAINGVSSRLVRDDAGAAGTLAGFATIDAKASFALRPGLDAEASGQNLLDENYSLYPGFPEAGRTLRVGLRYRF